MTTIAAPADVCPSHGVKHRAGSKVGLACAAAFTATSAPVRLVEVTVEHVHDALSVYGGRIALLHLAGDLHVMAGSFGAGETLADRTDLWNLLDHLGSLEAVAADLTLAVQWEQEHAA